MQYGLRKTSLDTCLDVVIAFGGFAHKPMTDFFHAMSRDETEVPITFIYGENDFFKRHHADKLIEDKIFSNTSAFSVHTVEQAGHHPYIDNPDRAN
mgnify:CR=1 FL=1